MFSKFSGKNLNKFKEGAFVIHNGYGKNGHYGIITKIISVRPDGDSKFFDVTYTHGKSQNNTDHDVHIIPKSRVPIGSLKILREYHPNL